MNAKTLPVAAAALLIVAANASATMPRGELLNLCHALEGTSEQDLISSYRCIGFIEGNIAAYEMMHGLYNLNMFCPPPETPFSALSAAVVEYLESQPDRADQPADSAVLIALNKSFPCMPAIGESETEPSP